MICKINVWIALNPSETPIKKNNFSLKYIIKYQNSFIFQKKNKKRKKITFFFSKNYLTATMFYDILAVRLQRVLSIIQFDNI